MRVDAEAVVGELSSALDGLVALDPAHLADAETVLRLRRQAERLAAVCARAVAAFDRNDAWQADGACSAAAWLAARSRRPLPTARRELALGRALRDMPAAEAAWLAGEVGEAQVGVLAAARTPASAEAFARDEAFLVGEARTLHHRHLCRLVAYWRQRTDPDGAEADARAMHDARRLHLSESFGGRWFLDGALDPVAGAVVAGALRRVEEELFAADWAEARSRPGTEVRAGDLARTPAQRRADALVELARRAGAIAPGARRPEPLFTVFVGYETFAGPLCELAHGSVVNPGSLLPWLDEAWIERVVFDGPDRVRGVGPRRRLFTGATRRAVEVRDRECFHQLCDVGAEECEIDHVEPFAAGGLTVEDNGRAACRFHHRRRHRRT
jgi:hypothetical protein